MAKKIFDFQMAQERSFLISKSCTPHHFADLASKFGSDKDGLQSVGTPFHWPPHTYGTFYEFLFAHKRTQIRSLFECGIGSANVGIKSNMGQDGRPGASLRLWREYFPFCEVTAIDIDADSLIVEDGIKSYQVDQTDDESVLDFWNRHPNLYFDIMIDDGLHNVSAGMTLLKHSIGRLNPDGYYIIEDVSVNDLREFSIALSAENYDYYIVSLTRPKEFGFDNNLIVIRAYE